MKESTPTHVSLAEALTKGPPPPGNLAVPIFAHGSLVVELYTPVGHDPQKPHTRDEVYFVARGKGLFYDGKCRHTVEAGSFLLLLPARFTASRNSHPTSSCGLCSMDRKEEKPMLNYHELEITTNKNCSFCEPRIQRERSRWQSLRPVRSQNIKLPPHFVDAGSLN